MPIDGPLMAIDGPHGTAMAIDELRWDLSTGAMMKYYLSFQVLDQIADTSGQKIEYQGFL